MSRIPRVLSGTAALVLPILISSSLAASASPGSESDALPPIAAMPATSEPGPSSDVAAISAAAVEYSAADASSAAALAEAASAIPAIDLVGSGDSASADATSEHFTTVEVAESHAAISDASGSQVGLSVSGDSTVSTIVDGATVMQDVSAGTDVVARAIPDGAQLVAILDSDAADTSLEFSLDLPEQAELHQLPDGSINISVPVEVEVDDSADVERYEREVEALVGELDTLDALDELTEEQWNNLESIAPIETSIVTQPTTVASIGSPWAVDANGAPVETYYEIEGETLTQHVLTTENTAFPVVADPSWWWWTSTAAKCALGVASFALGGAKVVGIAVKLTGLLAKASKGTQMYKAYQAWKALGGTNSARIAALGSAMKILTANISRYGFAKGYSLAIKQTRVYNAGQFLIGAGKSALELAGVYSCYQLVHEAVN